MQQIGEVTNVIAYQPPQQAINVKPEDVDKVMSWHKIIEGVYNVRALPEAGVIAWVATLGNCDGSIMSQIIKGWVAEQAQAPKPADLLKLYREYKANQQATEASQKILNRDNTVKCKYCQDQHYFRVYLGKDEKDTYNTNCYRCSCCGDGELEKILADKDFIYSETAKGFVRNNHWIGE